jgi:hypothetical protein
MSKWYWPTWVDWLRVYGQPVTNLANKGYGNQNIYWNLVDISDKLTPNDTVNIMWAENHRLDVWYDRAWIDEKDVFGFFPDTNGKLWFTNDSPYIGLYRTHPDLYTSFTNMVIETLHTIFQTQLLLDRIGCDYIMHSSKNLWCDGRPLFLEKYQTTYQHKYGISEKELEIARKIMSLKPVQKLIKLIDWSKFLCKITDPYDARQSFGIWEYYINNKEYVSLKHETDHHPNSLAHHDYALEVVLGKDSKQGRYRQLAKQIAEETVTYSVPTFTAEDFVIAPEIGLLDHKYKVVLENLS